MDEPLHQSMVDIVHDRFEIYPIAAAKYGDLDGIVLTFARADGGPSNEPWKWSQALRRVLRDESRQLLQTYLSEGQAMLYLAHRQGWCKDQEWLVFVKRRRSSGILAPDTCQARFACFGGLMCLMCCFCIDCKGRFGWATALGDSHMLELARTAGGGAERGRHMGEFGRRKMGEAVGHSSGIPGYYHGLLWTGVQIG